MKFKHILYLMMVVQFNLGFAGVAVVTVGEGQDLDCDYHDLQTAINDQVIHTEIRVTQALVVINGIEISNQPIVKLSGGFDNCQSAANGIVPPQGQYTTISNGSSEAISVVKVDDNTPGSPLELEITGFDVTNSQGGIDVTYNPNEIFNLNLNRLDIHNNVNRGINLVGESLVVSIDTTKIHDNINIIGGSTQGGGIRCIDARVDMLPHTAIYNNIADNGGGIYAIGCEFNINAGDTFGGLDETGIFGNTANDIGGGLYVADTMINGLGTFEHALKIHHNTALDDAFGSGGAIYLASGSNANLVNTLIEHNSATFRGSAVFMTDFSANSPAPEFHMGPGWMGCSYAEICSSINNNSGIGNSTYGTIYIREGGFVNIHQTEIAYNKAANTSGIYMTGDSTEITLEGNLIHHNNSTIVGTPADNLMDLSGNNLPAIAHLNFNTISDNDVNTVFNLAFDNNVDQTLAVYNSIIHNNGAQIINENGANGLQNAVIDCSLLHDFSVAGYGGNDSFVGMPDFYGHLNYQLQETSSAIDPDCSQNNNPLYGDIKGVIRNTGASADLGAYETVVFDTVIFKDGFQ